MTRAPSSPIAPKPHSGWNGNPEFAHHDYVQRCAQFLGHLECDRHATARQPQHDNIGAAQVPHPLGQVPPRIGTINEEHLATFAWWTVL